jgi:DnaJ-like protein
VDDHYTTLRVRPNASRAEIEQAYRRLARANHPDLLVHAGAETKRRAEANLKRINAAYRVVGDPQRRRDYDRERTLRAARQRAVAHPARPPVPGTAAPRRPPPVRPAQATEHWQGGGPLKIEWTAPPQVVKAGPAPEPGWLRRLLIASLLIVAFFLVLTFVWRPVGEAMLPAPRPLPAATATPNR